VSRQKKLFTTIIADPPYAFDDALPGKSRGASKNYQTLTIEGIFNVEPLTDEVADDARLFLWRPAALQEEAIRLMTMWGFAPKAELIWVKEQPSGSGKLWFGMGRQVRNAHETCLIGTRGRPERLSRSVRSVFRAPYTGHSAKPDEFYEIVEELSPGPYLELFARRRRGRNWTCRGDEL